ncbi:50S ribosomal protein L24 [Candidatus Kaiserbacteria bacterium RIFCSPLOWO2_02_FULL_56_11]|uniref:Large ribosomal subunit protein uL24 n=2 Tax=Candidatus Kaiseribacteriota TaxID=1752734 RepID=A0A1F6E205_9BACT|nr:MAG: 50S ribosomal protein L24 [Candidatus Kaiserbacteria bacterium RIFCSPHIGHO2_02_FULL_56_30]OGG72419.1 MAG: 50S ribosomal protein L24 [Candidatus Kaiserbacteria bacterium RIFCSPHIGHO2_12_FULL_56_13]OGG82286.1 MAG: 50S ribosomal protein L24 [Candidatus Kaiserbacteria bacterium RIFCSPLOWO2_02_FULL_56_11]
MKLHVKKGDKVKVLTGKDKGKIGTIVRALPKEHKVVIEGVNVAKRHLKKRGNQSGRIVERPMPIHVSNVAKVEK